MAYENFNIDGAKIVSLDVSKLTILPIPEGQIPCLMDIGIVWDDFEYRLQEIKACEKNYWE